MVFISLLVSLLGLGYAKLDQACERKDAERWANKGAKSLELQDQLDHKYSHEVYKQYQEYLSQGHTREETIPMLYKHFDIPMKDEIKDPFLKNVVIQQDGYAKLIELLVKRDLYAKGYSYSYDGKGSRTYEFAKSQALYREDKSKYPWL